MTHVAYHEITQLPFWTEAEIEFREMAQAKFAATVRAQLQRVNAAWKIARVEGPMLTPRGFMSPEYSEDDIWMTRVDIGDEAMVMRAETTASTYAMIRRMHPQMTKKMLPYCFWQVGKSFRREQKARANQLRYYEFTQQEFQCLYPEATHADYREELMPFLCSDVRFLTGMETRVVDSDRLPSYSDSTKDIEVDYDGVWREVASVSIRNDFAPDIKVLEIAIGLDRIVKLHDDTFVL